MADKRPKPGETLAFDFAVPSPPPPSVAPVSPPVSRPEPASVAPISPPVSRPVPPSFAPPSSSWVPPFPERPAEPPPVKQEPKVLSVAQLGRVVGRSLERTFEREVWVEGEVTSARPSSSGHVYFCLKDEKEDASLDVVVYRSQVTPRGRALVKDGARVRVRGKPTYWSPRGKLQFVADRIEATGKGALLEALEKLRDKLREEGLFDPKKKRPLPADPRVIGVVTSAQGAVIHDICKVAFRRGGARILLAPAVVQGPSAAASIRRALKMLQQIASVDVIVIGRGGGSQDDLLAFHDEELVRDVAACRVPIVSAVGHEVDVTLVDFAADARAATPSQAAEMTVPDTTARRRLLTERTSRLERAIQHRIADERVATGKLAQAFRDPRLLIASAQQRVDEHVARLERLRAQAHARDRDIVQRLDARLGAAHPRERIARDRARAAELSTRVALAANTLLRERRERVVGLDAQLARAGAAIERPRTSELSDLARRLGSIGPAIPRPRAEQVASLAGRLDAMSPLKVLGRGYAIVTRAEDGRAVRDTREVAPGDRVRVRVDHGAFEAEVLGVEAPDPP